MTPDEIEASQNYEQVDREGDLAESAFNHLSETAVIARLDLTSVALFLLATTLANLQFYAGISPAEAVQQVEDLIAAHVEALVEENRPEPGLSVTTADPRDETRH